MPFFAKSFGGQIDGGNLSILPLVTVVHQSNTVAFSREAV